MKLLVNAKLNRTLKVLSQVDGYHMLNSHVDSVSIFDTVTIVPNGSNTVSVNNIEGVVSERNTAYLVAVDMTKLGCGGVDINIVKGIPQCSGLGGSSADAAAVIFAMCHLNNLALNNVEVLGIAKKYGSDITYMITGGCAVISGKGDDVEVLPYVRRYYVVTNFNYPLSTAEVFASFDKGEADTFGYDNHLQSAVEHDHNYMCKYVNACKALGKKTTMTGSGSSYFVECSSDSEAQSIVTQLVALGFDSVAVSNVPNGITILQQ